MWLSHPSSFLRLFSDMIWGSIIALATLALAIQWSILKNFPVEPTAGLAFEHECFAVRYIPSATEHYHPQKLASLDSALTFSSTHCSFLHLCLKACSKLHRVPAECATGRHRKIRLVLRGATSALGGTLLEAVAELAVDGLQVLHAAGAGGLSPLGLLAPVVCGNVLVMLFCCCRSDPISKEVQVSVGSRRVVCDVHFLTLALG